MINLISRKVLGAQRTSANKCLPFAKIYNMETHQNASTFNKMNNPEVKRKSSSTEDHSQKQKYRKKRNKRNDDKASASHAKKPYTWFLAIPSKFTAVIHFFRLRA